RVGQAAEAEHLLVVVAGEGSHVGLQLLGDERFEDLRQGVSRPVPLVAGSLVDKRDDPDGGETVLEDGTALGKPFEPLTQHSEPTGLNEYGTNFGKNSGLVAIGRVAAVRRDDPNRRICARD